jgi:hypothetical protein
VGIETGTTGLSSELSTFTIPCSKLKREENFQILKLTPEYNKTHLLSKVKQVVNHIAGLFYLLCDVVS